MFLKNYLKFELINLIIKIITLNDLNKILLHILIIFFKYYSQKLIILKISNYSYIILIYLNLK